MHELLQNRRCEHIHYIVRSRGDRSEHQTHRTVRQALAAEQPVAADYAVEVQNHKTKVKRSAQVELRFGSVVIQAGYRPKGQTTLLPTRLNVVWVREPQPPKGEQAVEWMLFTSLPVDCLEQALQVVEYYKLRWRIETFHYVLKQGCSIEKLQIEEPQALQNAIATFSIIALQVFRLRCHMQANPLAPVEAAGFDRQDYWLAATYLNAQGARHDAEKPNPTVEDFARVVAQLGGNMLWKKKPPGVKSLWRGLADLHIIRTAYEAFNSS